MYARLHALLLRVQWLCLFFLLMLFHCILFLLLILYVVCYILYYADCRHGYRCIRILLPVSMLIPQIDSKCLMIRISVVRLGPTGLSFGLSALCMSVSTAFYDILSMSYLSRSLLFFFLVICFTTSNYFVSILIPLCQCPRSFLSETVLC